MTIFDVWKILKETFQYLITKWKLILVIGLIGGLVGLSLSFLIKPKYTAKISFSLIDGGSKGSGLFDLASSFGLASLMGGNDVFSGDNLLEIMKSKYAVEETLLSPVMFEGEKMTLIEAYIKFNHLRKKWSKSKKNDLRNVAYPIGQNKESFSRTQDSIVSELYKDFIKNNALKVLRLNKKVGMSEVTFTSKNEEFSKLFVENLMKETYVFYRQTKTAQIIENVRKMEQTADSIKHLYESALTRSSAYSGVNVNPALQSAMVPKLKQEYDAQLYGTVYAEVLKNLETLKLDLARETPLVQVVDLPRYPLKKEKLGKVKGIVLGGLLAGFFIVMFLLIRYFFRLYKDSYDNNNR